MKWIARLVLIVVVLLLVIGVGVYFYMDSIARQAVERGGTYATGVETTVDSVSLGVFTGEAGLNDLKIANPEGFTTDHFLTLGEADMAVSLGSLMSDEVHVPRLHLNDIDLQLEKKGDKQNYEVILENLEKLGSGEKPVDESEAKQWIIEDLRVRNINVTARVGLLNEDGAPVKVTIPELALQDVQSDSLAELQGQVLKQVLGAVLQQAAGQLPGVIVSELQGGLSRVGDLGEIGAARIGDAAETIGGFGKDLGERVGEVSGRAGEEIGKAAGEAEKTLKGIGENLGGILGGDRKKEAEPAPEADEQP